MLKRVIIFICCFFFLGVSLIGYTYFEKKPSKNSIVVGCKNCSEQSLLGEMIAQMLETHTDLDVVRRLNLDGTMICFTSLQGAGVDIYPEYTGAGLVEILKQSPIRDKEAALKKVREEFIAKYNVEWLDPFGFNNCYTLITTSDLAKKHHLTKISQMADLLKTVKFAADPEVISRKEFSLFEEAYKWPERFTSKGQWIRWLKMLDTSLLYLSLKNSTLDAAMGYGTDGRIKAYDLMVLEDDLQLFPSYLACPIAKKAVLEKHPEIRGILGRLANTITDKEMMEMNYLVDEKHISPNKVAKEFLVRKGLI